MPTLGALHSVPDVKLLILYILDYAGRSLSKENLVEIVQSSDTVEYFDFSEAFDKLLLDGLIDIKSESENNLFRITDAGKQTLELFRKELPFNVIKKNSAALLGVLSQIERKSQIKTKIEKHGSGYYVTCTLLDGDDVLLEYKLFVPDQLQAALIASQFEEYPTEKYKSILSLLIDQNLF
jgi:hypothetical protein